MEWEEIKNCKNQTVWDNQCRVYWHIKDIDEVYKSLYVTRNNKSLTEIAFVEGRFSRSKS